MQDRAVRRRKGSVPAHAVRASWPRPSGTRRRAGRTPRSGTPRCRRPGRPPGSSSSSSSHVLPEPHQRRPAAGLFRSSGRTRPGRPSTRFAVPWRPPRASAGSSSNRLPQHRAQCLADDVPGDERRGVEGPFLLAAWCRRSVAGRSACPRQAACSCSSSRSVIDCSKMCPRISTSISLRRRSSRCRCRTRSRPAS